MARYPDFTDAATHTPALQRFSATTLPMNVTLQRDEEPGDASMAAEPETQPEPATPSAPQSSQPPSPPPPGPQEPEELLKTLFDPLLRKLRTELRLDRERRGVISDRW